MVTVYTKPHCVNCEKTKTMLNTVGVGFNVEDLTDPKNFDKLMEFKDRGFMSAPIVVTDDDTWAGFQEGKIKELAEL